jgi:hypothetical protein
MDRFAVPYQVQSPWSMVFNIIVVVVVDRTVCVVLEVFVNVSVAADLQQYFLTHGRRYCSLPYQRLQTDNGVVLRTKNGEENR